MLSSLIPMKLVLFLSMMEQPKCLFVFTSVSGLAHYIFMGFLAVAATVAANTCLICLFHTEKLVSLVKLIFLEGGPNYFTYD